MPYKFLSSVRYTGQFLLYDLFNKRLLNENQIAQYLANLQMQYGDQLKSTSWHRVSAIVKPEIRRKYHKLIFYTT